MKVPEEFSYSEDHEWTSADGGKVRVGITDYAQDALGDVVFIESPAVGATVEQGKSFGEVESTKSVSDLFAPISGTVSEVNDSLDDAPELLNEDPYGDGWICVIEASDPSQLGDLLDAAAYRQLVED
jgi:glycine cleavage system H protein